MLKFADIKLAMESSESSVGQARWFVVSFESETKDSINGFINESYTSSKSISKWWIFSHLTEAVVFINTKCPVKVSTIYNFSSHGSIKPNEVRIVRQKKIIDDIVERFMDKTADASISYTSRQNVTAKNVDSRETWKKARDAKGIDEALAIIADEQPQQAMLNWNDMKRRISEYFEPSKRFRHEHSLDDFRVPKLDMLDKRSVHMFGPSGVGKTSFACAHFKNPLFVSKSFEGIADYNEQEHDGIVFDEMDFTAMSPDEVKTIVDIHHPRTWRRLYGFTTIPAGVPRIFTSNREKIWFNDKCADVDKDAILTRIQMINVKVPLYKTNVKVNDLDYKPCIPDVMVIE